MAVAAAKQATPLTEELTLGECPACGRPVAADATALRYRGGFHHMLCALRRRDQSKAALLRSIARSS